MRQDCQSSCVRISYHQMTIKSEGYCCQNMFNWAVIRSNILNISTVHSSLKISTGILSKHKHWDPPFALKLNAGRNFSTVTTHLSVVFSDLSAKFPPLFLRIWQHRLLGRRQRFWGFICGLLSETCHISSTNLQEKLLCILIILSQVWPTTCAALLQTISQAPTKRSCYSVQHDGWEHPKY